MSDAPERIWVLTTRRMVHDYDQAAVWPQKPEWADDEPNLHEYIRADLARLPDGLAERLKRQVTIEEVAYEGITEATALMREVLTWNEQQEGEKE